MHVGAVPELVVTCRLAGNIQGKASRSEKDADVAVVRSPVEHRTAETPTVHEGDRQRSTIPTGARTSPTLHCNGNAMMSRGGAFCALGAPVAALDPRSGVTERWSRRPTFILMSGGVHKPAIRSTAPM